MTDPLLYALIGAALVVGPLIGWTLWRGRRRPAPYPSQWAGDTALLVLLSNTGPMFVRTLVECGVPDAKERIERLAWEGYVQSEPLDGGLLYALTPAGGRRARQERDT